MIPIKEQHTCQVRETVETLSGKIDLLRRDMRTMERNHNDDVQRLWIRIALLTAAVVGIGNAERILCLLEVFGI